MPLNQVFSNRLTQKGTENKSWGVAQWCSTHQCAGHPRPNPQTHKTKQKPKPKNSDMKWSSYQSRISALGNWNQRLPKPLSAHLKPQPENHGVLQSTDGKLCQSWVGLAMASMWHFTSPVLLCPWCPCNIYIHLLNSQCTTYKCHGGRPPSRRFWIKKPLK